LFYDYRVAPPPRTFTVDTILVGSVHEAMRGWSLRNIERCASALAAERVPSH